LIFVLAVILVGFGITVWHFKNRIKNNAVEKAIRDLKIIELKFNSSQLRNKIKGRYLSTFRNKGARHKASILDSLKNIEKSVGRF